MNKWKGLALLFTILSFGALRESWLLFKRHDRGMIPVAIIMTGIVVFLAIRFWIKAAQNRS